MYYQIRPVISDSGVQYAIWYKPFYVWLYKPYIVYVGYGTNELVTFTNIKKAKEFAKRAFGEQAQNIPYEP